MKTMDAAQILTEVEGRRVDRKLTVVQMLPELECGGVERGTLEMARFLVEHGHRSIVVSEGGQLVAQLEREGSTHIQLPVGTKSLRCLGTLKPLRKLLKKSKVDIFHLRSRLPAWLGFLALKNLAPARKPIVFTTFHGFYSVNGYSAIMAKGDCVIAVSKAVEEHIKKAYGLKENIRRIYRGVDPETFNPEVITPARTETLRRKWRVKENLPVLMLPGRVSRLKGQHIFLQSLTKMRLNQVQAVIVGGYEKTGSYLQELQEIITRSGLGENVRLVGHCDDMPAALALADIVISCSSSRAEAFGRTIVEAMAMGKPVLATAHGGSVETILPGTTGWLVEPANPEALATQLDRALQDTASLQIMGKRGREHVRENFTTTKMCETTLSLYLEYMYKKSEGTNESAIINGH